MNAPLSFQSRKRCRGSALVLVFWCLLLLGLAVFAVVEMVSLSVDHASENSLALEARAQAMSGIALAQAPQILTDDPLLHHKDDGATRGFQVTLSSEGARLNLNYLLLTQHREVLVNLFNNWGATMEEAQRAADCLSDWVTPGDLPSLNGAKAADYARAGLPQRPSHAPFQSFEEVEQVLGMDRIAAINPDWEKSLTLWSEGPLDVTAAPAEQIAALFGISTTQVESLVHTRNGPDGVPGTLDDKPLTPADLEAGLAVGDTRMKEMKSEFVFGGKVRRIDSIGWSGDVRCVLSAVVSVEQPSTQLAWFER